MRTGQSCNVARAMGSQVNMRSTLAKISLFWGLASQATYRKQGVGLCRCSRELSMQAMSNLMRAFCNVFAVGTREGLSVATARAFPKHMLITAREVRANLAWFLRSDPADRASQSWPELRHSTRPRLT